MVRQIPAFLLWSALAAALPAAQDDKAGDTSTVIIDLAITDCQASAGTAVVSLAWTAPEPPSGSVAQPAPPVLDRYEIRWSDRTITVDSWPLCAALPDYVASASPGDLEVHQISVPAGHGTTLHVAIQAVSDFGDLGGLSNVPSAFLDLVGPGAVTDLAVDPDLATEDSLTVTFTEPADDNGLTPGATVASIDLRYSIIPILDLGAFSGATPVGGIAPAGPGRLHAVTVGNLSPSRTYFFAVRTADSPVGGLPSWNVSPLSTTSPSGTTLSRPPSNGGDSPPGSSCGASGGGAWSLAGLAAFFLAGGRRPAAPGSQAIRS